MSDALIQKGTTLLVGFGSFLYTGYVPEDGMTDSRPADNEIVKDENNATLTKMISDPRQVLTMSLIIKGTTTIDPPIKGATVTVVPPKGSSTAFMCDDATVTYSRTAAKLSMTLIKESSMTYT